MKVWESPEWKSLMKHATSMNTVHLSDLLGNDNRVTSTNADFCGSEGHSIFLDYSRQRVTEETMALLYDLAKSQNLQKQILAMAEGAHLNSTEDRAVMHFALRAPITTDFRVEGHNVVPDVHAVLKRVREFSLKVRSGDWRGATGKHLSTVISIGIGGSYLGPEFLAEALRADKTASAGSEGRSLRFLANVDPVDVFRALDGLNPETTLVIICSKTFTTAETMLNARTVRSWLLEAMPGVECVCSRHIVACSASIELTGDFGIPPSNVFGFWDWVGGRFSVCSAIGMLPISLHYGPDIADRFLSGAAEMDQHFLTAELKDNLPILMGLIGVWNSSFLHYPARALLPYSQALSRFAAHIQQVDMESNGKRVTRDGTIAPIDFGEINFGEPGTNGQHSFYQLLHQGRVIPCDFIGCSQSQHPINRTMHGEFVSNHDELMSNFFAQPDALAYGKSVDDLKAENVPGHLLQHKAFPGNRPSLSLLMSHLDAQSLGQLLALYEHRTAVQGFIWGINSFDQWGVELGKVLASKVRNQLAECRSNEASVLNGFNKSTRNLISKYLQHESM
jgi:glucose-6-phosphate isomerase